MPGSWLSPGTDGRPDVKRFAAIVPHLPAHEAYLCGPGPWMEMARKDLVRSGIPASHIHDERFNW